MRTLVQGVRTVVLTVSLLITTQCLYSQVLSALDGRLEVGANIGPLFFLGDLGGNPGKGGYFIKDVNLPVTKMAKGLYGTFYPDEALGFRVAFNTGMVEGADSLIADRGGEEINRMSRNLHFRSKITEGYAAVEFYPTVFMEQYDGLQGKFRPYLLAGVGLFHFNPQGQYQTQDGSEQWVDLQPLHLEGQGMQEYPDRDNYKLTQVEIPFGGGFKYYIKEKTFIGLEILYRKTFTDYIDDVSTGYIDPSLYDKYLAPEQTAIAYQMYNRGYGSLTRPSTQDARGNPRNNDSFFSTVLRLGWRISSETTPRQARCPRY